MTYGPAHRLFLQVMMLRRSLEEEEAVQQMRQCSDQVNVKARQFETFVEELNGKLQVVHLALRSIVEEREDGDYPCLVLVNSMGGEATRTLSSFSKQELSFMQHLVETIASSEEGELEVNDAIYVGLSLPQKMRLGSSEKLLERLIEENWLIKNTNNIGVGSVSLSALTIAELSTYLEERHGKDILKCFFCTKMTFKGFRCKLCNVGVHRDCGRKYWASCSDNTCPGVGCNAILELPAQPKRRRVTRGTQEEEDDREGEEEEEEEEEKKDDNVVKRITRSRRVKDSDSGEDFEDE